MNKKIMIWENSLGDMFISWVEKHESLMYNDPKCIETIAARIGVSVDIIYKAIENKNRLLKM